MCGIPSNRGYLRIVYMFGKRQRKVKKVNRMVKQNVFPRWRGFHLLNMIAVESWETRVQDQVVSPYVFQEKDFQMIAEWGFNFVRIPLNYRCFTKAEDRHQFQAERLKRIDEAVQYGLKWGVHVNLALHRAPGYCIVDGGISPEPDEELNLWKDREAQELFALYWEEFARRYQGIPSEKLSFNLVNEPCNVAEEAYAAVCRDTIRRIHKIDPCRLCIVDGLVIANHPVLSLCDLAEEYVGQAFRGYMPSGVTHFGLQGHDNVPEWPYREIDPETGKEVCWGKEDWDRHCQTWASVAEIHHMGVICGELGCYCHTPHDVVLRWMEDLLQILEKYNFGYTVWNLRGEFGILNSERTDVEYEDFRGEKLDRKMLELLKKY